jgi:Ca2+-binding RTX toxin-like protein
LIAAFVLGSIAVVMAAATATNNVPTSNADQLSQGTGANELKPAACAGITLTTIVTGDGATVNGTAGNDLILGGPSNNRLNGNGGTDCMLGGAGNDNLRGGAGNDICIGGPGTDTFNSCATQQQ